jgi:GTPase SAR1 family protein
MIEKEILILGMPGSGKTTFLAAFQHYIEADLKGKELTQYKYSPNSEYLNRIHKRWLNCEQQIRTVQEMLVNEDVKIFLESADSGEQFVLNVPDLAGEVFSRQWEFRNWDETYRQRLNEIGGLVLFIHPEKIKPHVLITDAMAVFQDFDLNPEDQSPRKVKTQQWRHDDAPTQVTIVDLLQIHQDFLKCNPTPIAFVISAWDTIIKLDRTINPQQWFDSNLPLLSQYLLANKEDIDYIIMGISAQGADYKMQEEREELQTIDEPANRIIVQQDNDVHKDISAPLLWILNRWQKQVK